MTLAEVKEKIGNRTNLVTKKGYHFKLQEVCFEDGEIILKGKSSATRLKCSYSFEDIELNSH